MSRLLQLELPDALYTALREDAAAQGMKPETIAIEALQSRYSSSRKPIAAQLTNEERAAQQRFERHFGTWSLGQPARLDNEQIDKDLAAEYGRH